MKAEVLYLPFCVCFSSKTATERDEEHTKNHTLDNLHNFVCTFWENDLVIFCVCFSSKTATERDEEHTKNHTLTIYIILCVHFERMISWFWLLNHSRHYYYNRYIYIYTLFCTDRSIVFVGFGFFLVCMNLYKFFMR